MKSLTALYLAYQTAVRDEESARDGCFGPAVSGSAERVRKAREELERALHAADHALRQAEVIDERGYHEHFEGAGFREHATLCSHDGAAPAKVFHRDLSNLHEALRHLR